MIKSVIADAFTFLQTISLQKLCNGALLRLSYTLSSLTGKQIHWGKPETLSIEPTSLCNLKCPECPSGNNGLIRNRTFLSTEHFQQIIAQNYRHLSYLQLFFQGEPLLHPELPNFIGFATKHRIYTSISTNGQLITKDKALQLVQAGLKRIIISIDGTSQEVYEQYRVGGSLSLATKAVQNIVQAKTELGKRYPVVITQMVVTKNNEHQIEDFKQLSKKLKADKADLKSAQLYPVESGHPLMVSNPKFSRYQQGSDGKFRLKRKQTFHCKRVWNGAVISDTLDVLPCCFDKNAQHSYGNIKTHSLYELWKSTKTIKFRQKVWSNQKLPDICKNCSEGVFK